MIFWDYEFLYGFKIRNDRKKKVFTAENAERNEKRENDLLILCAFVPLWLIFYRLSLRSLWTLW
jgi:hypothetical protein